MPCPRKTVKQHNRCVYWLTRAGEVAPLRLAGPDFRYTKNSARPGSDFIYTNFSGGLGFPSGGDVGKICHFQIDETTFTWDHFFTSLLILFGGDLDEMIDFQSRKMALQGPFFRS